MWTTYQTLSFAQWLVALPIGSSRLAALPVIGAVSGWPIWVQILVSAFVAVGWLTVIAWLLNRFNKRKESAATPTLSQTASGAGGDILQAGRDINQTVAAPGRDRTKITLRTAILQQIPIGQELLDSCSKSSPEGLQAKYDTWVGNVKSLLEPEYPDLVQRFIIAPVEGPSRDDYTNAHVTFGHDDLWPEIWKKISVLKEIDFELS